MVACALVSGCGSGSVLTKQLGTYIARQNPPLSSAELDRLYAREVRLGDTLDRVQAAWEGCEIELSRTDGALAIYDAHVPYGARPIRIGPAPGDSKPVETIRENGKVILTLDRKQVRFYVILDAGIR